MRAEGVNVESYQHDGTETNWLHMVSVLMKRGFAIGYRVLNRASTTRIQAMEVQVGIPYVVGIRHAVTEVAIASAQQLRAHAVAALGFIKTTVGGFHRIIWPVMRW